jgi:hypothetical protein
MTSTRSTTITLRLGHRTVAEIDRDAKRAGLDRNAYLRSWLPYVDDRRDTPNVASGGNEQRSTR